MPGPDELDNAATAMSDHVTQSLDELAEIHLAHYRGASWLQHAIDRLTSLVATPQTLVALSIGLLGWLGLSAFGRTDPSLSRLVENATSCGALLIAILILVTQRREDQLAERRARLTLQLAILADKKNAKIIALLEELRRDQPNITDRIDPLSDEMAEPTDVPGVLAAIDERAGGLPAEPNSA